jgi:hypothetical protein
LKIEDENSKSCELGGRAEVVQNKKRKIEAIMHRTTRSMMKYLAAEQHDSIQAQDKEVIELEESDKEQPNNVKRTTPNKNPRSESFLSPSPSF